MSDETKPLKAYSAHDGYEGWATVFATNGAAARRYAANEMDCDFNQVETCKRIPWADQYAPGPIPFQALYEHGWWSECAHCGVKIEQDAYDYDKDEPLEFEITERGALVFCTPRCVDEYEEEKSARESAGKWALGRAITELAGMFPEIEIQENTHVYVPWSRNRELKIEQVVVHFKFPGCQFGGSYRRDNGGEFGLFVANGDREAWNAYRGEAAS